MSPRTRLLSAGALLTATLLTPACRPPGSRAAAASATSPAASTYVAPGAKDQFYLFYSGGHSGQVYVAGLPSMRHIATIPVFARYPATGYGYDEERRQMLGEFTWGDMHHPGLSQTDGRYDGRWLFVNDNANNRVARIDLRDFKTRQILGPIPNSSGTHGSSFVTENTEYVLVATRFSIPLPKGRYADPQRYEAEFNGMVSGLEGRSEERHAVGGVADPDPAVQLGPRIDRQGTELGLGLLDLVQLRDGRHRRSKRTRPVSIATTRRSSTGAPRSRRSRTARAR